MYYFKANISLKAELVIVFEFHIEFNFSIKSKILINFVELFDSKTAERSLRSSFVDFI